MVVRKERGEDHEEVREEEGSFRKGCRPEYRRFEFELGEQQGAGRIDSGVLCLICPGTGAWFRRRLSPSCWC